ncbi:hypothetical protein VTG60DRAFT_1254 [Thermothelomyces hinnuleus]
MALTVLNDSRSWYPKEGIVLDGDWKPLYFLLVDIVPLPRVLKRALEVRYVEMWLFLAQRPPPHVSSPEQGLGSDTLVEIKGNEKKGVAAGIGAASGACQKIEKRAQRTDCGRVERQTMTDSRGENKRVQDGTRDEEVRRQEVASASRGMAWLLLLRRLSFLFSILHSFFSPTHPRPPIFQIRFQDLSWPPSAHFLFRPLYGPSSSHVGQPLPPIAARKSS